MKPSSPLVSVLIPAYNSARWIGETLDSALGQTHKNLEVIVVDDGSIDETVEVVQSFADPRLKLIRQENAGACAARNRALAEAHGEFIQYLDADDLLALDKIDRQVQRLATEPPDTVASCAWSRFYNGDLTTATQSDAPDWRDFDPALNWLIQSWEGRGTFFPAVWLIPRAVAERAGSWNEELLRNQDGEYMARVLVNARRIAFSSEAWAYYRSGLDGSVSRRSGEAVWRSLYEASLLCERTLLGHLDTPETRRACAGLWQQFLFATYPDLPDLLRWAEIRIDKLGGMYRKPGVIRPLRPVRDLLGWKPALRLQRAYMNSGLQELIQRVRT